MCRDCVIAHPSIRAAIQIANEPKIKRHQHELIRDLFYQAAIVPSFLEATPTKNTTFFCEGLEWESENSATHTDFWINLLVIDRTDGLPGRESVGEKQ